MTRWGQRADQLSKESDMGTDKPPELENFIETNYRLFTVISIFAGLGVYLTSFQDSLTEATRMAVGAVLILFLLSTFVAFIKSFRCAEQAWGIKNPLLLMSYSFFMYGFFILGFSIFSLAVEKYFLGLKGVVGSGILYSVIFMYFPFIFGQDTFENHHGGGYIGKLTEYTPHIALGIVLVWFGIRYVDGGLTVEKLGNIPYALGVVSGIIVTHFIATALIYNSLKIVYRKLSQ